MLSLKKYRDKNPGVADLLNWAALIEDGIVQCKDGSLLVGWYFQAPDIQSSTMAEREWLVGRVNTALSRLDAGWATWTDAVRVPANYYPAPNESAFPDRISRLVDEERRLMFSCEGQHFETRHVLIVQFMPPLRRKSVLVDMIYDDDAKDETNPAERIIAGFKKSIATFENTIGSAVKLKC